ncbi:MAG: universal stress protein [Bacteroidota bacterium]
MARNSEMDILLVHYYSKTMYANKPLVRAGDGSVKESFLRRLKDFAYPAGDGLSYPFVEPPSGVNVGYECQAAFTPSAAIIKRAQQADIDLIVMATHTRLSPLDRWLGSTAITVSESCDRPIFLVPPNARYTPFNNIVVANHQQTADPYPLWQLEGLVDFYGAEVHFVTVEDMEELSVARFVPWKLMEQLAHNATTKVDYTFTVSTVDEDDISEGLLEYADDISADLIVIVNQIRNRWYSLVHASLTQDLALRSRRPILVLHTEKKR